MRRFLFVPIILTLFLAGQAAAQSDSVVIYDRQTTGQFENAGAMIGSAVVDRDGENIGMIDDVLFSSSGEASYLIVSHPETTGERVIPVPFAVADPQRTVDGDYVINVDRQTLASAPSFTRDEVVDYAQADLWEDEVRGYFGVTPAREDRYDYTEPDIDSTIESSKEKGQMTNPFGGGNRDRGNFGAGEPRWPSEPEESRAYFGETRGYFGDDYNNSYFDDSIESSKEKGQMTNPFGGDNRDQGNFGAGEPRWPSEERR